MTNDNALKYQVTDLETVLDHQEQVKKGEYFEICLNMQLSFADLVYRYMGWQKDAQEPHRRGWPFTWILSGGTNIPKWSN